MSFGLGGNLANGISKHGHSYTSSWYLEPDELQQYINNGRYPAEEMEGCWLVDKRAVVLQQPGLAFKSPMPNPELVNDEQDEFLAREYLKDPLIQAMVSEFAKGGGAAAVASGMVGGLDYVSPTAYVAWWELKGARIGQVRGGRVIWLDSKEIVTCNSTKS